MKSCVKSLPSPRWMNGIVLYKEEQMSSVEQSLNQGILTLTLNRPEKLNALNAQVLSALSDAFTEAKTDKNVKGILITGAGKAFCAGADIQRLATCNAQSGYEFASFGQAVFRQLETLGKPSMAAINGYAFGGGCELAMATTLRMASTMAQFGQPEIKLGIIPGYGGTQRLARLVGKGRALDLCLTGRFIDAPTALNWGLVSDVVAPEALLEQATQVLRGIVDKAPLAMSAIMATIDYGCDLSLTEAMHLEAVHFATVCASQDKQEGVSAFLEKRVAVFSGQ